MCNLLWVLLFRSDTNLDVETEVVIQSEDCIIENTAGPEDKCALSS